jgi:homoserine kinase
MPLSKLTVIAPATTANLGPGFDVFGLAFKQPHDKITLTAKPKGVSVEVRGLSADSLPVLPKASTASIVAHHVITEFSLRTGVQIEIDRGIAPGVGLGSSAAAAAGVAYGLDRIFKLNLDNKELVRLAAKGEAASAGSEHADNVSAAIYGGFTIVRSYNPLEIVSLKAPEEMEVGVAYPHMPIDPHKTEKARSVVPKQVPIEKAVHNVGSAAALASGFANGDIDLIGASMSDLIVEPERAALIPGYQRVKDDAFKAGACGVAISGAGPGMIAIVNKCKANSSKVAEAMKMAFESTGLAATAFVTTAGRGVHVLEMEQK